MRNLKIQLVFNNCDTWTTIDNKVAGIKAFYATKFNISIDVLMTSFSAIPFASTLGSDGSSGIEKTITTEMVDPVWYDENITAHALMYDMVLFYVDKKTILTHLVSSGIRGDNEQGPVELTLFGMNENDHCYQYGVDLGDCFTVFACHEIAHGLYLMFGGVDNTHKYFYSTNPSAILNDFNFSDIIFISAEVGRVARALQAIKNFFMKIVTPTQTISTTLKWDTPANVQNSVRLLCDQMGLAVYDKNVVDACIHQESGYLPGAIGPVNKDGSRDWGICQFNDGHNVKGIPLWIGPGAYFATTDEVLTGPEKCVREMIAQYKLGHISWWVSFSSGAYLKYMPK